MRVQENRTHDPEKHQTLKCQRNDLTQVVRRPVEVAGVPGYSAFLIQPSGLDNRLPLLTERAGGMKASERTSQTTRRSGLRSARIGR
jgi:hypothetical protein